MARSAVQTRIEAIHSEVERKLSLASNGNDKIRSEFEKDLTFDTAMRIAEAPDSEAKQLAVTMANTISQEARKAGDMETAKTFENIAKGIANSSSNDTTWTQIAY